MLQNNERLAKEACLHLWPSQLWLGGDGGKFCEILVQRKGLRKAKAFQAAWQLAGFPERGRESRGWGKPHSVMQSCSTVSATLV